MRGVGDINSDLIRRNILHFKKKKSGLKKVYSCFNENREYYPAALVLQNDESGPSQGVGSNKYGYWYKASLGGWLGV